MINQTIHITVKKVGTIMMMDPDRSEEKKNLLMHDTIEPIWSVIWTSFLRLFNFGTYQFLKKNRGDESAQVSINLSSHQAKEGIILGTKMDDTMKKIF